MKQHFMAKSLVAFTSDFVLVKATMLHKAQLCHKNEDNFRNYCQLAKVELFLQVSWHRPVGMLLLHWDCHSDLMPLVADVSWVFRVFSANLFPMFYTLVPSPKTTKAGEQTFLQIRQGCFGCCLFFPKAKFFIKKLDGNPPSVSNLEVGMYDFICITSPAIRQPDQGGVLAWLPF